MINNETNMFENTEIALNFDFLKDNCKTIGDILKFEKELIAE